MSQLVKRAGVLVGMGFFAAQTSFAADIFMQDFENLGTWNTQAGGLSFHGGSRWVSSDSNAAGLTETIFVSNNAMSNPGFSDNGEVTEKNWDIHDGSRNEWLLDSSETGFNPAGPGLSNNDLRGNRLGHVDENYASDTAHYYQIDGIDLSGFTDAQLMFDYDSWIESVNVDAFAVAVSSDGGSTWGLLNPTGASNMQYDTQTANGGDGLSEMYVGKMTGQIPEGAGAGSLPAPFQAFDNQTSMTGTGMFNLSTGQTISLRFAFGADSDSSVAEGINIDNIKITGTPDDPGGSNEVPEPLTLGLVLGGLAAVGWRRRSSKRR